MFTIFEKMSLATCLNTVNEIMLKIFTSINKIVYITDTRNKLNLLKKYLCKIYTSSIT